MKKTAKATSEKAIRTLLEKHACPIAFHEVRTRFLGSIATPGLSISPMRTVAGLWGGEMPKFDSLEDANALLEALVQGLWNDLTLHQKRSQPFRLMRLPMEPTAENLGQYGLIRLEELGGFIEELFNGEDEIELPERAHEAVENLCELRAIMGGLHELVSRDPNVGDDLPELEATFRQMRELTRIMETEIHEAVLSCARARRQIPAGILTTRSAMH